MIPDMTLGQVISNERRLAGMTQDTLSKASGISYSTLAKIERGAIVEPSIFTVSRISEALRIPIDILMAKVTTGPDGAAL